MITTRESQAGNDYGKIPDVIVIYISEFDFLKGGKTIYHVEKILRETGKVIDDGQKEIYVNTAVDDHTDIAALMSCFTKKLAVSSRFPVLTNAVKTYKTTEGGADTMCAVMQKYEKIAEERGRKEGRLEGKKEGRNEGMLEALASLFKKGAITAKAAGETAGITEEEFIALIK